MACSIATICCALLPLVNHGSTPRLRGGKALSPESSGVMPDSPTELAISLLNTPEGQAVILAGLSTVTTAAAAYLGCMDAQQVLNILGKAKWPLQSVRTFTNWMKKGSSKKSCVKDPLQAFDKELLEGFKSYSITEEQLRKLLVEKDAPQSELARLTQAVGTFAGEEAAAAFTRWRKALKRDPTQAFELDPAINAKDSAVDGRRHCDYIPGFGFVCDDSVLKGPFRLWAGANEHRVLTVLDGEKMPESEYERWRMPGDGQSKRVEVHDTPSQGAREEFVDALPDSLDFIAKAAAEKKTVVVHCAAGQARSVAVVLANKMVAEGLPLATAFKQVAAQRPQAMPNPHFMKGLVLLDDSLSTLREGSTLSERRKTLDTFVENFQHSHPDVGSEISKKLVEQRVSGYLVQEAMRSYQASAQAGKATALGNNQKSGGKGPQKLRGKVTPVGPKAGFKQKRGQNVDRSEALNLSPSKVM